MNFIPDGLNGLECAAVDTNRRRTMVDTNAEEKSSRAVILTVLTIMAVMAGGIVWVTSPTNKLLGDSIYAMRSAVHGLSAGIFMVAVTIGLFQGIRLWSGVSMEIRDLEIGSLVNAGACFLTIVSGNWLYIPYRAPGGPRTHFLETVPEIHQIFFEFKEFTALFTLPLTVGAAYLICRYGPRLLKSRELRETTALLLGLAFFYFVVAFGLGAAVTKLYSV